MIWFIILCCQLALLFSLSNVLKKKLFILFYLFSKNQTATITFISLLLYPGVVVHEFSHLIAAVILFVPVKSMTLVPKVVDGKIQGGSVVIQKVDVFRRTLVGVAPLFGGLAVLWLITVYLIPVIPWVCHAVRQLADQHLTLEILKHLPAQAGVQNDVLCSSYKLITSYQLLITILSFYLLFSISSTMYSSKKDLEALLYSLPVVIVGIVLLYILGFQASWIVSILERFDAVFTNLSSVLALVLIIQVAVYLLLSIYSTMIKPTRSG